jgi:hypothetical protein
MTKRKFPNQDYPPVDEVADIGLVWFLDILVEHNRDTIPAISCAVARPGTCSSTGPKIPKRAPRLPSNPCCA